MKRKLLMAAMFVAAMGPGRSEPPPTVPEPVVEDVAEPAPTEPPAPEAERAELQVLTAADVAPAEFLWVSRPVVVFADSANDPAFVQQMQALTSRPEALLERDVVVVTDTDPDGRSEWRQTFHPSGFSLVLLDKDGQVKQRKPSPWDVREITRAIDKFPLRRQEIGRAGVAP